VKLPPPESSRRFAFVADPRPILQGTIAGLVVLALLAKMHWNRMLVVVPIFLGAIGLFVLFAGVRIGSGKGPLVSPVYHPGWRLTGKTWPHPFFDRATRAPIRTVTTLSQAERDALRPLCGPRPSDDTGAKR
jgi:hypothetical protein